MRRGPKPGPMSELDILQARGMRRNGLCWERVIAAIGCSEDQLRRAIEPGYSERRNEDARRRRRGRPRKRAVKLVVIVRKNKAGDPARVRESVGRRPDATMIAAQEAYVTAMNDRTLSQSHFGDPPPGYSSLDKIRRGERP